MNKACQSINCSSCGGSVQMYSRDYGTCDYCGNTNRMLSDGKTEIPLRQTKIENLIQHTPKPEPARTKLSNKQWILIAIACVLCGAVIIYFFKKRSSRNQLATAA